MENTTVINPAVQSSSATVINTEVVEEYNRQNNIETDSSSSITEGTTICDKYKVQSQLEVSSGEADLFLCSDGSRQYVAKVYKRKFAIKQEVIDCTNSLINRADEIYDRCNELKNAWNQGIKGM